MELPIVVEKVIYRNDNGFATLGVTLNPYSSIYKPELEDILLKNIKPNDYGNFILTVNLIEPHEKLEGRQYIANGDFVKNKKYGDQFKCEFMYLDIPSDADGLRIFLCTLPNIKEARSSDIIKTFGAAETLRILDEDIEKLIEINGITAKRIPPIKEAWNKGKGERELFIWLNKHGIPPKMGKDIYAEWHQDSLKILTTNPYKLVEIKGFGFKKADLIAHKIFEKLPKDFRTIACMYYVLQEDLYKNGNLCMPYSTFISNIIDTLKTCSSENCSMEGFDEKEYKKLVPECIKSNLHQFAAVKNITKENSGVYVYLKEIWEREKYIAGSIYKRRKQEEKEDYIISCDERDLDEAEKDISSFTGREIKLDDCQKEAIKSVFQNRLTVITGPGGSGKSAICRCIFKLSQDKKLSIRMMSPTGKAARVLSEKTNFTAETIHRSLKLKPDSDFPAETIKEDVVIIDEVSMVGVDTMFAVMTALEENLGAHIIFVGDCNQIPSVSPGNFLYDIMNSDCVNIVRLDKIHRQDEHSYIPLIANDISLGKVVEIPSDANDIKWHNLNSSEDFDVMMKNEVTKFIKGNSIDDLQIISPMYKGVHGINQINDAIQDLMAGVNGTKLRPFIRGFSKYFIGDRVIQTVNNYEKSVFNGDMGKIVDAGRKSLDPSVSDEQKDYLVINFYGQNLTYVDKEIDQLRLAWCVSIHKFQGSQSPYIIYVLSNEANIMLSKEIVYTGLTRASEKVDIYGHMSAFRLAPTKSIVRKRYTNMNSLITELKESKKIFKVLE